MNEELCGYKIETLKGSLVVFVEPYNRVSLFEMVQSNPLLDDKGPQIVKEPLKNIFSPKSGHTLVWHYTLLENVKPSKGSM